jgi:hypothetical protein
MTSNTEQIDIVTRALLSTREFQNLSQLPSPIRRLLHSLIVGPLLEKIQERVTPGISELVWWRVVWLAEKNGWTGLACQRTPRYQRLAVEAQKKLGTRS